MKIGEMDYDLSAEREEYVIKRLLAGEMFTPYALNKVMKYLHFDDEEVICVDKECSECPFVNAYLIKQCLPSVNNYVRNLVKGEMRVSIEDIL